MLKSVRPDLTFWIGHTLRTTKEKATEIKKLERFVIASYCDGRNFNFFLNIYSTSLRVTSQQIKTPSTASQKMPTESTRFWRPKRRAMYCQPVSPLTTSTQH